MGEHHKGEVCKTCGTCPTCGRRPSVTVYPTPYWYGPNYYPWWGQTWTVSSKTSGSSLTSTS